jgi:hypothetical protein
MSDLLVMKFGGTSMGSAARIRVAAEISAEQHARRPVVTVVSAMSKVTDLLLDSLRKAEAGDQADLDENLKQLYARHFDVCRELLPPARQETALAGVHALISEFSRIAKGMVHRRGDCDWGEADGVSAGRVSGIGRDTGCRRQRGRRDCHRCGVRKRHAVNGADAATGL